jgi:hypothetical protein
VVDLSMVVTVVTENVVVQVSDVQLTSLDDGKPLDEKQRKSAVVVGTDAAFVIGWTGFAKSSNQEFKTGVWLFNTLNHIKAYKKPLVDILGDVTGQADVAFYPLPDPLAIKGTRFVLGGWYRKDGSAEPFTAVIFNNLMVNEQGKAQEPQLINSPTVDTKFLYSLGNFLPVGNRHSVRVDSPGAKEDWVEEQGENSQKGDEQPSRGASNCPCLRRCYPPSGWLDDNDKQSSHRRDFEKVWRVHDHSSVGQR